MLLNGISHDYKTESSNIYILLLLLSLHIRLEVLALC